MGVKDFADIQKYWQMQVRIGGKPTTVYVELTGQGLTCTLTARLGRRTIRMVFDRDTAHVLAGVLTRALNNCKKANQLAGIGGFEMVEQILGWHATFGKKQCTFDVSVSADAGVATLTITGLGKKPISIDLDPETLRLVTWFLSKGLYNVKVGQKIRY
jgi:hypothetical protein